MELPPAELRPRATARRIAREHHPYRTQNRVSGQSSLVRRSAPAEARAQAGEVKSGLIQVCRTSRLAQLIATHTESWRFGTRPFAFRRLHDGEREASRPTTSRLSPSERSPPSPSAPEQRVQVLLFPGDRRWVPRERALAISERLRVVHVPP